MNMQNDNQSNPDALANSDNVTNQPLSILGEQKVIQQTPETMKNLQTQQQQPQATVVSQEPTQSSQPINTQSVYPQQNSVAASQMQVGIPENQVGWIQPSNKSGSDVKKLIVKAVFGLVILGAVVAVLFFSNIITFSEFKTLSYTNSKGTRFQLTFYAKHSSKQLQSGNTQLVSKVSKNGKFPVVLSISDSNDIGYARVKECGGYTKAFDVENKALNQTISVCDFGKQSNIPAGVYVAGISQDNKYYIVTIGQDYSGIGLSSQSEAQKSLSRFGLDSYQDDIRTIISSIKVE